MRYSYTNRKEDKHKFSINCMSKCIDWKLNMNMIKNKTSFGLIFQGKGNFFSHLDQSTMKYYQFIDKISEVTKNTIKNLEEKYPNKNSTDEIKFPLENLENSYLIIENNLEYSENLNNLVFLEFDLISSSHNLKHFREINNHFIEREINFVLNGSIHGTQVFKKDLKFSVCSRKLVKSIQFRIDNYKTDFMEKQVIFQNANPTLEMRNSKTNFFTKILGSQNIGIEFSTPNFELVEKFATNFNSIVNSNSVINKICFEMTLPLGKKKGFNKDISFSNVSRGYKTEFKDLELNKKSVSDNFNNSCHFTNLPFRADNSSKPYYFYKNHQDYYNINKSSNESSTTNYNNYYSQKSRDYYNYNNRDYNSTKNNSEISIYDMVPKLKSSQTNFRLENNNKSLEYITKVKENEMKKESEKNIKLNSFNILNSHYEGLCNFLIFSRNSTPFLINKSEYLFNKMTLYEFFLNFEKVSVFGLEIPFIYENSVATVHYSPTLSSMEIMITDDDTFEETIDHLFKLRKEGLFSNELPIEELDTFLNSKEKYGKLQFEITLQENLKLICFEKKIKIEFYEIKPHHSRQILIDQFNNLFKFDFLKKLILSHLNEYSWFSVLWTPFKALKSQLGSTSFLTYYQFCYTNSYNILANYKDFLEIPIIGILPLKLEDNIWLTRIIKDDKNKALSNNIVEFKFLLEKSISNVYDFVISNSNQTSLDYEIFLKCN